MWRGSCYSSNVTAEFPENKNTLDKYKELLDPNERERLQVA
jgi:hypothetical protein